MSRLPSTMSILPVPVCTESGCLPARASDLSPNPTQEQVRSERDILKQLSAKATTYLQEVGAESQAATSIDVQNYPILCIPHYEYNNLGQAQRNHHASCERVNDGYAYNSKSKALCD